MRRPLIVTDRGSRDLPFIAKAQEMLREAALAPGLFGEIEPNPTDSGVAAGAEAFRAHAADGVIAIGGGSGMDGAKGVALTARQQRYPLWDFVYGETPPDLEAGDLPPLITVPTTAGTGAETESTAMVTDLVRKVKGCVWHPLAKPKATILDPELTLGLPKPLTAWTGCDALVHAIEAYCVKAFYPLCDGAALQGLQLIWAHLRAAVADGRNIEARSGMLAGSCLAGISFGKGLGMVHGISHAVGAVHDTHHGLTNAIVLPAVLRFNAPEIEDRLPGMAAAMGLPDGRFDTFYRAVVELLDELEIPQNLAALGVPESDAAMLAEKAAADGDAQMNPRQASLAEMLQVVTEAIAGSR